MRPRVIAQPFALLAIAMFLVIGSIGTQAQASSGKKPNILFIMGDDIGWMQVGAYHRGIGLGETPNIDRLAKEGGMFTTYYAMQSCTSGRNVFLTGMYPLRTGMIPPQLPGSPSYLRPGTPSLAVFLHDLGYFDGSVRQESSGRPHRCIAHGTRIPGVSGATSITSTRCSRSAFLTSTNRRQSRLWHRRARTRPIPGLSDPPGSVDPRTTTCLTPPRPVLWCHSSDGTSKNQTCKDEGPLTLERSKTVDEEISAKVVDFLDRNDPTKTGKPFFVWYNPARMHVTTVLSPKYMAMVGTAGGKDWGVNEAGMKQLDDNVGVVLAKLEQMGQLDNTIIVFTTDNGAEAISYPDGGVTPFKGQKGEAYEGGYRAPCVIRWPGVIKPGTVFTEMFSALDWMPTFVQAAGGPSGDGLKKKIESGTYPGITKTTLDGVNQTAYLTGQSNQSARDVFYYFSGATPSAVRYKNWKMYYTMSQPGAEGWILPLVPFHFTLVDDIRRDPFEQAVGFGSKECHERRWRTRRAR